MKKEILLTIDRFEGRFAVCFDDEEREFNIERIVLPDMKEGECFLAEQDGDKFCLVRALPEETARRRAEAEAMLSAIFSKNKGKR